MPKVKNRIPVTTALTRKVLNDAVARAAESHLAIARQLAPVDTGLLRASIRIHRLGGLKVVSEAPYSAYVEFGGAHSDGQPFFLPAFDSAVVQFRAEISQAMNRALR